MCHRVVTLTPRDEVKSLESLLPYFDSVEVVRKPSIHISVQVFESNPLRGKLMAEPGLWKC